MTICALPNFCILPKEPTSQRVHGFAKVWNGDGRCIVMLLPKHCRHGSVELKLFPLGQGLSKWSLKVHSPKYLEIIFGESKAKKNHQIRYRRASVEKIGLTKLKQPCDVWEQIVANNAWCTGNLVSNSLLAWMHSWARDREWSPSRFFFSKNPLKLLRDSTIVESLVTSSET